MTTFDNHANLAFSTVATAPSPATTGTSLTLASGGGARFPAAPFNITISPANASRATMATAAEIARVTNVAGDVLTITRASEGPNAARSVVVGDEVALTVTAKDLTDIESNITPAGVVEAIASTATLAPAGWLFCDGTLYTRTTYPQLFAALVATINTFTVTLATPGVFTTPANHNLVVGDTVYFETTGALPTGLTADVGYVVTAVPSGTTFRVSASQSIVAGVSTPGGDVATSGSQSGTHTLFKAPWHPVGGASSATQFYVPDFRGDILRGNPAGGALGAVGGETTHTLAIAEIPAHDHNSGTAGQTGTGGTGAVGGSITAEAAHTHPMPHTHSVTAAGTLSGGETMQSINYQTNFNKASGSGIGLADLNSQGAWLTGASGGFVTQNHSPITTVPTFTGSAVTSGGVSTANTSAGSSHTHAHTLTGPSHSHALASVGSGSSHNTMPPYETTNYIIKT